MSLRREWALLLDSKQLSPVFLSSGSVAFPRSGFPTRIERLRHVRHQLVGAHEFRPGLMRFALFQQRCSEAVRRLGITWLQLRLCTKLFLGFHPLEGAGIHLA